MIDLISREEVLTTIKNVIEDKLAFNQPNYVCRFTNQCQYLPKVEWFTEAIENLPTHGIEFKDNTKVCLFRTFLEKPKNDYYF